MDLVFILALILLNGVFAMSEIAIVSSNRIRLQKAADNGSEGAKQALLLAKEPTRFLSTIQVGITLIGILAGALGEASIARRLEVVFLNFELIAPYAQPLSWALMVIIITFLSLIFGELVPKRLALQNPEGIAKLVSRPMEMIAVMGRPLVWLLSFSTEWILKLLRVKAPDDTPIIAEEIHSLMKLGKEAGVLDASEDFMVRNVLRLDSMRVGNLMTLRKELVYVDIEDDIAESCRTIASGGHSRVLLCRGGLDHVIGILYVKDLFEHTWSNRAIDLTALCKPPYFVSRHTTALQLLEQLRKSKSHLAVVSDGHGQTAGVVTVNDVLAAIVGDIPSEDDDYQPDLVQREDGSWLVSGRVDIATFKEHFDVKSLPEEESGHYHTVGGLMLNALGRLPRVTDVLELGSVRLEVMDMDKNRVDQVLVSRKPSA